MIDTLPGHLVEYVLTFLDPEDVVIWATTSTANYAHIGAALQATKALLLGGHRPDTELGGTAPAGVEATLVCKIRAARNLAVTPYKSKTYFAFMVNESVDTEPRGYLEAAARQPCDNVLVNICVGDTRELVDKVLHLIATWRRANKPSYITISCDVGCGRVLTDAHLRHIWGIPYVALLGNRGITDQGLHHLARANALVLRGCTSIKGNTLPHLVYTHHRMFHIDWSLGWGPRRPFSKRTRSWLQQQHEQGLIVSS